MSKHVASWAAINVPLIHTHVLGQYNVVHVRPEDIKQGMQSREVQPTTSMWVDRCMQVQIHIWSAQLGI